VTTSHRCPCRTLGDRPLLSPVEAAKALGGATDRLRESLQARSRVPLSRRTTISFSRYASLEAPIIRRLVAGESPHDALGDVPLLPERDLATWRAVARGFRELAHSSSRQAQALGWFSVGMLGTIGEMPAAAFARPWREAYDQAQERSVVAPAAVVLGDFLADKLWDLTWLRRGPFDRARMSLVALARIGATILDRLVSEGVRPDRAAAEAVIALDIGSGTDGWSIVVKSERAGAAGC